MAPAAAQQAIVNLPSADVTPRGKFFLMHETQVRNWNPGRYWLGTNFFCYGVGANTELAITTYAEGRPKSPEASVGFGFKTSQPLVRKRDDQQEWKLTVGQMGIVNYRGQGMGSFTYSHLSFRLPETHTRITAGGFYGTRQLLRTNTGNVMVGVEHPVGKRFVLMTEWFGGAHDFGFLIPGILFHPSKKQFIVAGYKIPNKLSNGRHGLVLEYGLVF